MTTVESTDLLRKIQTRGHWRTLIKPSSFVPDRIAIDKLLPALEQARVELRGWDYPHVDPAAIRTHLDFIEQSTDWEHHKELFRFYQSGQFVHYRGFHEDWRDESSLLWPPDTNWAHGARLGMGAMIYHFTEVFEFAARLAGNEEAGDEVMSVSVEVHRIRGRHFYVDHERRFDALYERKPDMDTFPYSVTASRGELLADARGLAFKGLQEFFKRVPSGPSPAILKSWQDEVGKS